LTFSRHFRTAGGHHALDVLQGKHARQRRRIRTLHAAPLLAMAGGAVLLIDILSQCELLRSGTRARGWFRRNRRRRAFQHGISRRGATAWQRQRNELGSMRLLGERDRDVLLSLVQLRHRRARCLRRQLDFCDHRAAGLVIGTEHAAARIAADVGGLREKQQRLGNQGAGPMEICPMLSKSSGRPCGAGCLRIHSGAPPMARDQTCSPRFMSVAVTNAQGGRLTGKPLGNRSGRTPSPPAAT
jgi:hypothetical protein